MMDYSGSPYRYVAEQWADRVFRTEPRPTEPPEESAASASPHAPTGGDWRDRTEHGTE